MKIVLLFSPDANQRALAHRLAEIAPVSAILVCNPAARAAPRASASARIGRLARGLVGLPLRKAWFGMLRDYGRRFPKFPMEPQRTVSDINDPVVLTTIRSLAPDLVIVSGTNLLKQPLIEAIGATGKVMNLHTGISPYMKGGPNCTNWCLAIRRFDLIGNTVMWIDEGIDSGNLIATERTPLQGTEDLGALHRKVMDHAHALLVRCVRRFVAGAQLSNVPQGEIGEGQLFRTRQWNAAAAARAVWNFYLHYGPDAAAGSADLRLVSPDG